MPSNAYNSYLQVILQDASDLVMAHTQLKTGSKGRQYGLNGINRAVIAMCVSAWEAYVEEVIKESIEAIRPQSPGNPGLFPALNASARSEIGRFNNPNSQNVRALFSNSIGFADVAISWKWQKNTPAQAMSNTVFIAI